MKLDKGPFLVNMNMVELDGKKVLVWRYQAESTKGKDIIIGEERPPRMIKPTSLKGGQWKKNEGGKPQQLPKTTFYILMAKYKEGRAVIRGRENRTIRNTKPDNLVSLGQASSSTTRSSSGKRSQTPPWQSAEGWYQRQQDCHPVPYFPVGPPMSGPWGPPPILYLPCPPWVGWYGPWALPPMPLHPGWLGPTGCFGFGGFYAGDDRYRHVGH
jgi:hypothetical protein